MWKIIAKRLLATLPTALLGSIVIFGVVQLIPGGPAYAVAGPDATPELIATLNHEMGLDRPLAVQYGSWLGGLFEGDMGHSLVNHESVAVMIGQRLPVTADLAASALLIALCIGIPLGIFSAARRRTRVDGAVKGLSSVVLSLPEFWMGMLAINLFALQLAWLPATGYVPWDQGVPDHLASILLPAVTLALGPTAVITRFTRSAMVDVLDSPYVRTAWALGLPARQIYFRFALKNALISVVTVIGIIAGVLFGGAVLIERVYVIPGLGDLLVQGVLQKDFPVVQGSTVVMMGVIILINLLVDLSYTALDPRTRIA